MKRIVSILAIGTAVLAPGAHAATVFNAPVPAANDAARASWILAIGETPQFLQDWESGYVDDQRVSGSVGNGLSISGLGLGGGDPKIESGAGSIGGSNPVGAYTLEIAEGALVLTLAFDRAVSYVGFLASDITSGTIGWGSGSAALGGTQGRLDSSEFTGIVFDPGETVTALTFTDIGGTLGWGIDNIEYGWRDTTAAVPLPAGLPLLAAALGGLGLLRRRRAALRG